MLPTGPKSTRAPENDPKQLTTIYKKNGDFDKQRKVLLENFKQSETHSNLLLKLKLMVESKIKQDPSILLKNKGKMGALIQGEIINDHMSTNGSGLLSIVDKDIQDKIIDSPEFHILLRTELKDIKRKLMGISDEDYAAQLETEEKEKEKEKEKKGGVVFTTEFKNGDYKNNFRVKNLSHRVNKPPRFNFGYHERDQRDGGKDTISKPLKY